MKAPPAGLRRALAVSNLLTAIVSSTIFAAAGYSHATALAAAGVVGATWNAWPDRARIFAWLRAIANEVVEALAAIGDPR